MLITLIVLAIFILSIVTLIIFNEKDIDECDVIWVVVLFIFIASLVVSCVIGIKILAEQNSYTREKIKMKYEERYNTIMAAAENEQDWILLASDITDYNTEIKQARLNLKNPWVSWFVNDVYNELPLIPKHYNSNSNAAIKEDTTHEK